MKPKNRKAEAIALDRDFLINQYNSIRAEIIKRLGLRNRVQIFAYIFAGTIFGVGTYQEVEPRILLIYPVIALFIAIAWSSHDSRIGELHYFIRTHIEAHFEHKGWDTYFFTEIVEQRPKGLLYRMNELSALGAIFSTQLLAIGLVLFDLEISLVNVALLVLAGVSILLTFIFMSKRRKTHRLEMDSKLKQTAA